jgi:CHAD domain-containing protein
MPAGKAVRIVLRSLLDEMVASEQDVRQARDGEPLHQFRVASRSARSVLRHAGDTLPAKRARKVSAGLAWLATLTGPVRDLDVHLLQLPEEQEVDALRDALGARREAARTALLDCLDSPRYKALVRRWSALVEEAPEQRGKARRAAGPVVDSYLSAAHGRILELASVIHPESRPEDLHRLRKRAKALRYLLENFRAFYPSAEWKAAVRELKSLQDTLGEYQDCRVQADLLAALAGGRAGSGISSARRVLLSLESRRERSFAESSARFQRFSSPEVTELFRRLYEPLPHPARSGA